MKFSSHSVLNNVCNHNKEALTFNQGAVCLENTHGCPSGLVRRLLIHLLESLCLVRQHELGIDQGLVVGEPLVHLAGDQAEHQHNGEVDIAHDGAPEMATERILELRQTERGRMLNMVVESPP